MLFNSLHFLVYFPIVVTVYFVLPQKARWMWLLAASCWFYMAFIPLYILILAFTIIIDFAAGLLIENATGSARKAWLALSIVANVGVLAVFKYYTFINDNVAVLFRMADWTWPAPPLGLLLPIGLSFHTFQAMSYTIEVYRGRQPAERHFGMYALYVMFFPQLVAGPVERPQNLLAQFREHHAFDYARVTSGLQRMTWGMFKKVAIADRAAEFVNPIYDAPQQHSGATLALATILFAFQIYCDFSGYSDIALGSAQVLGFRLMENFRRPYFAKTIAQFWARWHISLSTWFRDYLYIPLGGNRVSRARWILNILIVFAVSGLWHGASWTFVVWGLLNGLYLLLGNAFAPVDARFPRVIRVGITFALTCFAWIFFRARSMDDALYIIRNMFRGAGDLLPAIRASSGLVNLLVTFAMIGVLLLAHLVERKQPLRELIARQPVWIRWPLYDAAIVAIVVFGSFQGPQAFIYFQF